uniref:Major facilitator superfamily (MFS) profile domain-containing protein n=1 Tax=Ditylenchus dipsaci TaxID=166011 RepID=A0A915E746_9BILA
MQPLLDATPSAANIVQFSEDTKKSITVSEKEKFKEKLVDFDQIFDFIKHYGRYQFFMLVVIQYIMLNSAGNYIFIAFATLRPSCGTRQIQVQEDACARIAECGSRNITSLFHSLYEEERFVCPQEHLPQHMQTLQAIGSGIGAIVGGHLADMFGRKWVTYIGALNMCAFGLMGAWSVNWVMLAVAMFGMGLAYGALVDSSMTLASKHLSVQIASFLAYLTADWRGYLISINALCLPKRRHEEACQELNAISTWNGCSIRFKPEDLSDIKLNTVEDKCKIYSLWDLFTTKNWLYTLWL